MKQNISLQEFIAINNPSRAKELVVRYGYRPARNYDDLIQKLFRLTREHREDALKSLVEIHPHKDLILNFVSDVTPIKTDNNSNSDKQTMCPVCADKITDKYKNFEGMDFAKNTTNSNFNSDWKSMLPLIVITSFVTASLVMILKSAK